ncbi:MAG: RNB domain-containing ribonuclease [Lachnospiraceae bacterium]|nr:RNB domain-containing ribonuclease [Lachnospiraceae bacterium]
MSNRRRINGKNKKMSKKAIKSYRVNAKTHIGKSGKVGKNVSMDARSVKARKSLGVKNHPGKAGENAYANPNPSWTRKNVITGVFLANARGYGFVTPDVGQPKIGAGGDIFIPAESVRDALHGDRVEVKILNSWNPRPEGIISNVLERGKREVVGTFVQKKKGGWVFAEDVRYNKIILVPKKDANGAQDRDRVIVKITDFGDMYSNPEGRVIEIIGHEGEPGADILTIAMSMDIPTEFSERVINQANRIPDHVLPGDLEGREDLRGWRMVTIDGPYAKDLDDAVSLTKTESGYTLGVHIADVSNYVQENSALDREALKRGTSVYLADRVIPMLPERLSNGICSLNAGQDRLALSVIMEMSDEGAVLSHRIVESVIHVDERMSYPDIQRLLELAGKATEMNPEQISCMDESTADADSGMHIGMDKNPIESDVEKLSYLSGESPKANLECEPMMAETSMVRLGDSNRDTTMSDGNLLQKYEDYIPMFCDMLDLSLKIRARRRLRGAIDFDFPEAKILLNDEGIPVDVLVEKANDATRLIEDFMLTANETVAEEFCRKGIPFVYRVHGEPDPEKVERALEFVRKQGVEMEKKRHRISPKEIQQVVESVKGSQAEAMISTVILRAMQQARYEATCEGHFGLAAKYYCHFTSPIRRYPDLQIHRIIHDYLRGRMTPEKTQHYREILEDVARQSSITERRAAECERETEKLKKAEYMYERIGQKFEGHISSVTGWGMYVTLPNTIEGLVRLDEMVDDYFHFDESQMAIVGRLSGRTYRIGDAVRVIVKDADLRMRTVDFELA